MGLADHVAESSPFQKWLAKNGADLKFDDQGEPRQMRIDTILSRLKSDSFENLGIIASEVLEKAQADRRTNVYSVTRRGTREIEAYREWEDQYISGFFEN